VPGANTGAVEGVLLGMASTVATERVAARNARLFILKFIVSIYYSFVVLYKYLF